MHHSLTTSLTKEHPCARTNRDSAQVGTGNVSVAKEVAEVQKLLKASGLTYTMHSAGTTVGELSTFAPRGDTAFEIASGKPCHCFEVVPSWTNPTDPGYGARHSTAD
jgi:hypothetical protein